MNRARHTSNEQNTVHSKNEEWLELTRNWLGIRRSDQAVLLQMQHGHCMQEFHEIENQKQSIKSSTATADIRARKNRNEAARETKSSPNSGAEQLQKAQSK